MPFDLETAQLFDLSHTLAASLLSACRYPWEALGEDFLACAYAHLPNGYREIGEGIFVHEQAVVSPRATIVGPCVVGAGSEIRSGAFIRGNALIGEGCVVGNSSELKNCILFDGAQIPHFNYVGDSILGYRAHMGAGAILSNVKGDGSEVTIGAELKIKTGRRKCGSFLGDFAEIGCNAVLCPGTVVGRHTRIYPLILARGVYPPSHIVKPNGIVPITEPDAR